MLFNTQVTLFKETRDSSHRVAALDGGNRELILNTNRISDITDIHTTSEPVKSRFFYSDNPNDRREGLAIVECYKSPAQLITLIGTSPHSQAVTLGVHKNNNIDAPVIDTTILVDQIAYVDRFNPSPDTHTWVCYYRGAFKRVEVLCAHGLEAFIDIIQTGTTTPA